MLFHIKPAPLNLPKGWKKRWAFKKKQPLFFYGFFDLVAYFAFFLNFRVKYFKCWHFLA